jgi:hypothetical protein
MARFEAALALAPAPGLHEAARGALGSLRGVSPERVLDELSKMLRGPRAGVACRALDGCGIADAVVPGYATGDAALRAARLAVLDGHGPCPGPDGGVAQGLAALLDTGGASEDTLRGHLEALRASRLGIQATLEVARLARGMGELAEASARPSARLRALRSPWFDAALDLACVEVSGERQLDEYPVDRVIHVELVDDMEQLGLRRASREQDLARAHPGGLGRAVLHADVGL